ncbi:uncharacterized protein [Antedon mediterranea]|uniref:uncharacterized protein isoform X2 n=1 Tax=Antedon mediterranea TaxID=105859 RepID=UPI003AF4B66C
MLAKLFTNSFYLILALYMTFHSGFSSGPLDITTFSGTPLVQNNGNSYFRGFTIDGDKEIRGLSVGILYKNIEGKDNVTWDDTGPYMGANTGTGSELSRSMPNNKIFPTSCSIRYRVHIDYTYLGVTLPTQAERVGVFSFEAKKNGVVTNSAIVLTSAFATIEMEHRTITVGIGESVTINLSKGGDLNDLRWRHNYGKEIHNLRGSTSAVIQKIRRKDDGVYECYTGDSPNGNHGIMRLIVRSCPSPKWNPPDCEMDCPVCYNGGVCDDKMGVCICPAGFDGDACKHGCSRNNWGRDCTSVCSSIGNCRGFLLCPPDPVGCACINGFGGKDCTTGCGNGYFGADCQQKCNCANSNCNPVTGCESMSTCSSGYTGDQCLEPTSCSPGFFGVLCNFPCHCKDSDDCNRDGSCTNGCHEAWAGPKCSIALPYRSEPPTGVNQTATTLTFDVTWIPGEDSGTGTITKRKLLYKSSEMDSFTSIVKLDNDLFIFIDNLIPNTQVQFYSKFSRMVGGIEVDGPRSALGQTSTICTKPLEEPKVAFKNIVDHEVTISLTAVSSAPERIQCNSILQYQVQYSEIDGNIQDVVNTTSSSQLEVELSGLSSCTEYVVNARVVNDFEIAGNWGKDMMVHTSPSEPSIQSNPFTNGTHLQIKWNASTCDISDYQVTYHYELSGGILQQETTTETEVVFGGIESCNIEYTFTVSASYLNVEGTSDTTKFRLGTYCESPNKNQNIQGYVIGVVIGSILWTVITVAVTLTVSKRKYRKSYQPPIQNLHKAKHVVFSAFTNHLV